MADPISTATAPLAPLKTTRFTLSNGATLYRVHLDQFGPTQFNPGTHGNARFSPIKNASHQPIPTLYAGLTMDCAMMETIFHDIPCSSEMKTIAESKLKNQFLTSLLVTQDLTLISLQSVALKKMGRPKAEIIESEKDKYPISRQLAEQIYAECPDAHGLLWTSRQDDRTMAIMLFGDRVPQGALEQLGQSKYILDDPIANAVYKLAENLDVLIVSDNGV